MKTNVTGSHWIITLPTLAVAAAYGYFVFLPKERSIAALRGEINAAEQFIEQVEALAPAIEATRQHLDKTRQYVDQWKQSAPTEDGLSEVFGRINRLAAESGITTTRFEPQPAVAYDTIQRLPVVVACVGSFDEICQFLQGLDRLTGTVWIERLRIQGSGESGESGEDVDCELSLAVFTDNPDDSDQVDPSE
jgi:Tfp pilus assembly protein PilO